MNNNYNCDNNTDKSINNNDNDNNITFVILASNFFYIILESIETNVSFYWTWKFIPQQYMTDFSASC